MKHTTVTSRGGHEVLQNKPDSKTASESKPDYRAFRDKALLHLYRSMNLCMQEMSNPKIYNHMRVKWANCLAQTVGALCNLIRTLKVLEAEIGDKLLKDQDLGELLQSLNEMEKQAAMAPQKYQDPTYKKKLRRTLNIDSILAKKKPRARHVIFSYRQRHIDLRPKQKRSWWRSER